MRIKKDAVPACLSDHRCFMRLISPFRGLSYFSALLIILSNSAANSQPAFIPSYNPLGYSQTPQASFAQDSFICPTSSLQFSAFGLDGDSHNRTGSRDYSSSGQSILGSDRLTGSGFGAIVSLSMPLSFKYNEQCQAMAEQLNRERRLNTSVSKFRSCAYLQWVGIDVQQTLEAIKKTSLQKSDGDTFNGYRSDLDMLELCSKLPIKFLYQKQGRIDEQGNHLAEPKEEYQLVQPPRPPRDINNVSGSPNPRDTELPVGRIVVGTDVSGSSEGYPDPGPVTGAYVTREKSTTNGPTLGQYGFNLEPIQRRRIEQ